MPNLFHPVRGTISALMRRSSWFRDTALGWTNAVHRRVPVWDSPVNASRLGEAGSRRFLQQCFRRKSRVASPGAGLIPYSLHGASSYTNPYPAYAALREHAPVSFDPVGGCWLVMRHDLVTAALKRPNAFSNEYSAAFDPFLAGSSPSQHVLFRQAVSPVFSSFEPAAIEAFARAWMEGFISRTRAAGRFEVVRHLSVPLPRAFTAQLLGLTEAETASVVRVLSPNRAEMTAVLAAVGEVLSAVLDEVEKQPRPGLCSQWIHAPEAERLPRLAILHLVRHLWFAGTSTLSMLIPSALLLGFRNPEAMAAVRSNPSRMPAFVSEILRLESPTQWVPRKAVEAIELDGVPIPAGALVKFHLASANRDPARFPDPDVLRLERPPHAHLAFGVGGHFCLGAAIARTLAAVALEGVLTAFPQLKLMEEPDALTYESSDLFRAVRRVQLELG